MSVRACRSTLCRQQFSSASDSERPRIVRVHPHEMPLSKIVELIFSLRVAVVTINFRRAGSTSSVLSKSIPDADDADDDADDEDAATLTSCRLPTETPHGWPDKMQVMLLSLRAAYAQRMCSIDRVTCGEKKMEKDKTKVTKLWL